jgi:hypothetical protein
LHLLLGDLGGFGPTGFFSTLLMLFFLVLVPKVAVSSGLKDEGGILGEFLEPG